MGHACTLTLTRGGLIRHINGIVAEATLSGVATDGWTPEGNLPTGLIHLVIVPALELLKQRRNQRSFEKVKVTQVLKEVLEEGLQDYVRKVTDIYQSGSPQSGTNAAGNKTQASAIIRYVDERGLVHYSNVE